MSAIRSENALVRPFAGIDAADKPLCDVRLFVNDDSHMPGPIVLTEDLLGTGLLRLNLPDSSTVRAQVENTVVPSEDCGLIVMAASRTHRITRILLQKYLKEDWPVDLPLNRSDLDLILRDRNGFTLTVAIVLLHDLVPEPLRPNMAGTWLARRDFSVSPETDETSFSPEELTDAIREHYHLPTGVLRYVTVDGVLTEENISDAVHVYLDPEVLNLLLASPADPLAVQVQTELAIQATEVVATSIVQELEGDGGVAPTQSSLEGYAGPKRFFENLAGIVHAPIDDILSYASDEPTMLRALLEAAFEMRAITSAALREK